MIIFQTIGIVVCVVLTIAILMAIWEGIKSSIGNWRNLEVKKLKEKIWVKDNEFKIFHSKVKRELYRALPEKDRISNLKAFSYTGANYTVDLGQRRVK